MATARALSGQARHHEAERLAREAAGLVPAEMPNLRADILVNLAEVLRAGGGEAAAGVVRDDAMELYERKGNVVAAARARSASPPDGAPPVTATLVSPPAGA